MLFSLHEAVRTSRMTWCNPFRHRSTQSASFNQNDQNALGQPWVDRRSNKVEILTKQHFSWFYIKPDLLEDFRQLWPSLTQSWLLVGLKNPNFDLAGRTNRNQCHCKDYQILNPTTIHGLKSELEQPRYHENHVNASIDASLTSRAITFDPTIGFSSSIPFQKQEVKIFPMVSRSTQSRPLKGGGPWKAVALKSVPGL